MPRGFANQEVGAIDPSRAGYCHPQQAKRTKCRCGRVCRFAPFDRRVLCNCGRLHIKAPGAAIAATGLQPVRPGGRSGCPGVDGEDS